MPVLKGFKEFILRGNVVELATAVIIGAAFTAIVTAFTDKIIAPLLAAIPTGQDCGQTVADNSGEAQSAAVQVCGLSFQLRDGAPATTMDFGAVIAAGINFLIVAAVVYFIIIVPYNKLNELAALRRGASSEEEAEETEVGLLTEIRDLLAAPTAGAAPTAPLSGGLPTPAPEGFPPADGPRHSR
ncbi:large conductance mechanosensitive channel protein MscL [Gordonia phosphorivorans]|uniref:Large-conductance mechanosensitive channel n=1 Tax=Gordonia phosphorivorans TaxID=1056982 RepID=A0ABV6HAE0_9ACTN